MAYRVELAPRALADLDAIYRFIKRENPNRAALWLQGITVAIFSLETLPNRCPRAKESVDAGQDVRVLLYGKRPQSYKIFFSIFKEKLVYVYHVRHWARKQASVEDLKF